VTKNMQQTLTTAELLATLEVVHRSTLLGWANHWSDTQLRYQSKAEIIACFEREVLPSQTIEDLSSSLIDDLLVRDWQGVVERLSGHWCGGPKAKLIRETKLWLRRRGMVEAVHTNTAHGSVVKAKVSCGSDTICSPSPSVSSSSALSELDTLVGLSAAKNALREIYALASIQQLRVSRGLKTERVSLHLAFTGNPGTGKTTVARLYAKLLYDAGLIRKSTLIETDASGLTDRFVGGTDKKTGRVIKRALGGVLFIDEAYGLAADNSTEGKGYGIEAINKLVKMMEDHRDDLVVVFAGYPEEMRDLVDMNPGLRSRIGRFVRFDDFETGELCAVFVDSAERQDYSVPADSRAAVIDVLDRIRAMDGSSFGNARTARQLLECAQTAQAGRLTQTGSIHALADDALKTLTVGDVMTGAAQLAEDRI
jgi:stage V sporulation protein K